MVMMTAGTMHVPVGNLVGRRRASLQQFNVKEQSLPGQRMVGVYRHLITIDVRNPDHGCMPVLPGLEHRAHLQLDDRQRTAADFLHLPFITLAIGLLRCQSDLSLLAHRHRSQSFFQAINYHACSFQKGDRLPLTRRIEHLAGLISQHITKGNNLSVCHGAGEAASQSIQGKPALPPPERAPLG